MPPKTPTGAGAPVRLHELLITRAHRLGPARAQALAEIGITTIWELLHELPRPAPPPAPWCEEGELPRGAAVRLRARLVQVRPVFRRGRAPGLMCVLERADARRLRAQFFQGGWLRRLLLAGEWFLWEGRLDEAGGMLLHPRFSHCPAGSQTPRPPDDGLRMQYRTLPRLPPAAWQTLTDAVLADELPAAVDPLHELAPGDYQQLLRQAHRPGSLGAWQAAVRQLAARELTALAWRLQALQGGGQGQALAGHAWRCEATLESRARARLPWALTAGQEGAWVEIRADLQRAQPMCRLLQGDVGSGKTALAFLACLMVAADGGSSWVLAPTAILARQHHQLFSSWLAGSRTTVGLLTGESTTTERAQLLAGPGAGGPAILVGTHALLNAGGGGSGVAGAGAATPAAIHRPGLVVIDEQHRFGVAQRMAALGGNVSDASPSTAGARDRERPDLLLLSATPIPRTLALTLYGDLPVSRIAGLPPGRTGVATRSLQLSSTAAVHALLSGELGTGERAFVICAKKRDHDEGLDAERLQQVLQELPWPQPAQDPGSHPQAPAAAPQIALIHGELSEVDKVVALADFAAGRARVLVATSVVEVGIDMPEATLLVVVEAERFGLAQLHQLRGRVGRGQLAGRCILGHAGREIPERLRILLRSSDGLAIAEADLAERGPGDLLGMLQAGAIDLRIADLGRDLDLLQEAHARVRAWRAAGRGCPAELEALAHGGGGDPAAG